MRAPELDSFAMKEKEKRTSHGDHKQLCKSEGEPRSGVVSSVENRSKEIFLRKMKRKLYIRVHENNSVKEEREYC